MKQFVADGLRNLCFHLIKQRNHIIVQRPFTPALEVNEIQLVVLDHDVARLEIAIHEEVAWSLADEVGEGLEVLAQSRLVEVDFLVRLDEIVFEVVQIINDGLAVETLGRVGLAIIQPFVT